MAGEFWLAVKFYSNLKLAGSPRNVLRRSIRKFFRGKATILVRAVKTVLSLGKLRILKVNIE